LADVVHYDGIDEPTLRARLDVPRLSLHHTVSSTLDVAHMLAATGTPAGTLVLADHQEAGRGRAGRRWSSRAGAGLWFTIIERPIDVVAIRVLSLRVGLRLVTVLDHHASAPVRLKWPNDIYLGSGKLAGILTEAHWTNGRPEWIAIGIGINIGLPEDVPGAAALGDTQRIDLLGELVPAVRGAAQTRGSLTAGELSAFAGRDLALGQMALEPAPGRVAGIDPEGHLLIVSAGGTERYASGSLVLEDGFE